MLLTCCIVADSRLLIRYRGPQDQCLTGLCQQPFRGAGNAASVDCSRLAQCRQPGLFHSQHQKWAEHLHCGRTALPPQFSSPSSIFTASLLVLHHGSSCQPHRPGRHRHLLPIDSGRGGHPCGQRFLPRRRAQCAIAATSQGSNSTAIGLPLGPVHWKHNFVRDRSLQVLLQLQRKGTYALITLQDTT